MNYLGYILKLRQTELNWGPVAMWKHMHCFPLYLDLTSLVELIMYDLCWLGMYIRTEFSILPVGRQAVPGTVEGLVAQRRRKKAEY